MRSSARTAPALLQVIQPLLLLPWDQSLFSPQLKGGQSLAPFLIKPSCGLDGRKPSVQHISDGH